MTIQSELHIHGIIENSSEEFQLYKQIWDACNALNIIAPDKVFEFFDDGVPGDEGILVDLKENREALTTCTRTFGEKFINMNQRGDYTINVDELPAGTKKIMVWIEYY